MGVRKLDNSVDRICSEVCIAESEVCPCALYANIYNVSLVEKKKERREEVKEAKNIHTQYLSLPSFPNAQCEAHSNVSVSIVII